MSRADISKLDDRLFKYQIQGVDFLESRNGTAIIADQMGLGKTAQAISYFRLHPEKRPVLIVCPSSLKLNWAKELKMWLNENIKYEILSGRKPEAIEQSNFIIINYDIVDAWAESLLIYNFKGVIIDECHYIKNSTAKRTKAVMKLCSNIESKILISGTPIKNRPVEFYTSLKIVDPERFSRKMDFLKRYCNPQMKRIWTKQRKMLTIWDYNGASNIEELNEKLKSIMIRREKSQVLKQLPTKRKIILPLDCDQSFYRKYKEAMEGFKIKGSESKINTKNKIEYLKQLCYECKKESVMNWIDDYISIGQKIVVFTYHTRVIDELRNRFNKISVKIDGSTKSEDRQNIVDRFQNDDNIKIFFGQIIAAGVGLTLTAASATAFVEFGWSPSDHEQAEDRVHRVGQTADSVEAYYLVAADTIDEKIAKMLVDKHKIVSKILDGREEKFFQDHNDDILEELIQEYKD